MVIATYRVATIPHDWHTIVRSRSFKVIDFNVNWKPVFDFLLVINSNVGLILHRLATIHPLQRTADDDGRQPCKTAVIWRALTPAGIPSMKAPHGLVRDDDKQPDGLTLLPWNSGRSATWDVTVVDTLGNAYLPVPLRLQLSEKGTSTAHSAAPTIFSSGTGNSWTHEYQHPGVLDTNRKSFDRGNDRPPWNDVLFLALVGHRPTLQRHMPSWHVRNFRARIVVAIME